MNLRLISLTPSRELPISLLKLLEYREQMVDQVRFHYQNQLKSDGDPEGYRNLKGILRLLKTSEYHQSSYWGTHLQENRRRLHDAFIIAPDLLEAYEALQFFHDIQASSPFSVQSEELTEWIRKYASSRVEEIRSAACTIRHWRSYIQNSWKYGKSNGLSEGWNNKIKVLKRVFLRFTQL